MEVFKEILKVLSFNGSEMIVQVVNFLILLAIMRIFFWKPILKLLDDRKQRVVDEFGKIDATRKEIEVLKNEYESRMRSIEQAAQQRIQEAVLEAKKKAEEIEQKAREEAHRAMEYGNAEIQFQIVKAKEELKQQAIDMTIQAAQQLVEKNFGAEDDKRLVTDFINRIDKMTIG